jgi:Xaa-Pro aminopeptidase
MMLIKEKISQARGVLKELGIDCWLTFARETGLNGDPALPFLTGADLTWHSALAVFASGRAIAIVGAYDKKTVEDTDAYDEVIGYVEGIRLDFLRIMRQLDPKSIAVNYSQESEVCDGLTHGMYLTLQALLQEIGLDDRLVSAEKIVSALRQRKTPWEIDHIRRAVKTTESLFDVVQGVIQPGRSEKEIADFLRDEVKAAGLELAWAPRTCPSVFTGPDTEEAHYTPTDRKVERGHVLSMDFGVKVEGYCSDMQRSFYVRREGESAPPPEVKRGFDTIVDAIERSRQALKPGARGCDIDRIARDVLIRAGYQDFPHGLGHQVGRSAHDGTALLGPAWEKYGRKPFEPIEQGMVFTLEPRLTVVDRGIVTIEEMVIVTADGAEYLSTPQREALLVG